MDDSSRPHADGGLAHYDTNYGGFQNAVYEAVRREAFGEDIGQNSWLTADEQDTFIEWLALSAGHTLLDVGCGAGGPALRVLDKTGCSVVGVDVHDQAISTARALASARGLNDRTRFERADARQPLPFPDNSFDAVSCIDAINHLPDRPRVIAEWARVLRPGGRLLFTDPIVLTGPVTADEIAIRSSIGFFLFVPAEYDERVIVDQGLRLLTRQDVTSNMATIAERRRAARESRSAALREIEGDRTFDAQQAFLATAASLAGDRRLSRFLYVAERLP